MRKYLRSVEDVVKYNPKFIKKLLDGLDLSIPGLTSVRNHYKQGMLIKAGRELIQYYQQFDLHYKLPAQPPDDVHIIDDKPDDLLKNVFSHYDIKTKQPYRADNRLNWNHLGPEGDKEWGYHLNRHFFIIPLLNAYSKTKDERYAVKFDHLIQDWILSNRKPFFKSKSVQWRGLEVAIRMLLTWPQGFYGFQKSDSFSDATRILMLKSIPEHCSYLRWWHNFMGNHLVMQMTGLGTAACCFSEFEHSIKWAKFARKKLTKELLKRQVYPDGVQKECSSHVHMFTLIHFDIFVKIMNQIGIGVSNDFENAVFRMWDYMVHSMRPNGYLPLNNDCWLKDYRYLVNRKCNEVAHDDWLYIITNGDEGTQPAELSKYYPWGGQMILRDGYGQNAQWCFFDTGPSGISPTHLHRDKLHISIHSGGRDILVDSGSLHHIQDKWRNTYYNSSFGHNVVIVDNRGQKAPERLRRHISGDNFVSKDDYDFGYGSYGAGYARDKLGVRVGYIDRLKGSFKHYRYLFYRRGQYWLVIDHLSTDRPRSIKALWHFHPECSVVSKGLKIRTDDRNQANLQIQPVDAHGQVQIVHGQVEPKIQGWHSQKYNHKRPSSCAVYRRDINANEVIAWLIIPFKNEVPDYRTNIIRYRENSIQITVQNPRSQKKESIEVDFAEKKVHFTAL